jgi:sugar phosphate isomerase/epimerase
MKIPGFPGSHLTYCLNIHPGETWDENLAAIRGHACRVRELVAPMEPFGLGLRLSRQAVDALADPARLRELRGVLSGSGLYAFTINGFPYGTFHGAAVKAGVYRPDWREEARLEYTRRLGAVLAAVLPDSMDGSISTVPVSYREWMREPGDWKTAVENLAACAAALHELLGRTGREIHLGLEPEPDCLLENTADTIEFYERHLFPVGVPWLARSLGCSARDAETVLRRHLGVCFDTCHFSVQFEDLAAAIASLAQHGIRISKVQISAALRAETTADGARRLAAFVDPVYLHQAKVMDRSGAKLAQADMNRKFLSAWGAGGEIRECRVHFHVPLYVSEYDGVASTAEDLTPAFFDAAARAGARHFEIETYTFHVLPAALRQQPVERSIADEYAWVLARMRRGS